MEVHEPTEALEVRDSLRPRVEALAQLRAKRFEIDEEIKEVQEPLLDEMLASGVNSMTTIYGTVSLTRRKDWIFSDVIREIELELKEAKTKEKKTAEWSETPGIRFTKAEPREEEYGKIH